MKLCYPLTFVSLLSLGACDGDLRPLQEAVESHDLQLASITITPTQSLVNPVFLNPGDTLTYELKALNTSGVELALDGADRRWVVSDTSSASISQAGRLTALSNGSVDVSVRVGGLISEVHTITVSDATLESLATIQGASSVSHCSENVYSVNGLFSDGSERTLSNVVWTLPNAAGSAKNIVSTNARHTLAALSPGQFTLRASYENLVTELPITVIADLESIRIQNSPIRLERGETRVLSALADRTDTAISSGANVSRVVNWTIAATDAIASFSTTTGSEGSLTGLVNGVGTVQARCGDISVVSDITVVEPARIDSLDFDPDDNPLQIRLISPTLDMTVAANTSAGGVIDVTNVASWSVTDGSEVLSVDNTGSVRGKLTALSVGTATLQVIYGGISESITVNVVN